MIKIYKLGNTAMEALIASEFYTHQENAEAANIFKKKVWKLTIEKVGEA